VTTGPVSLNDGRGVSRPDAPGDLADQDRIGGGPGFPDDQDRDDDVDVLYLAGQHPAGRGEWLLITGVDGLPGAEFTARVLPADGRQAHGGDVLVHLAAQPGAGKLDLPAVRVSVWAAVTGLLIPVAAWDREGPEEWPERIRATVAFAMSVLTELEEHGADLGPSPVIDLDNDAATAVAGIPAGVTLGAAGGSRRLPGR
jgi:hypothetical protein